MHGSRAYFYSKVISPCCGGSWNLKFLVSLPYWCYIPNLVQIGSVEEEVNTQQTTIDAQVWKLTHSNRSPEGLGWTNKIKSNFKIRTIVYFVLKSNNVFLMYSWSPIQKTNKRPVGLTGHLHEYQRLYTDFLSDQQPIIK